MTREVFLLMVENKANEKRYEERKKADSNNPAEPELFKYSFLLLAVSFYDETFLWRKTIG